ncbi:2-oxoacid:acceptor oxidoreductase family protein [Streptomyces prasinus]
MRKLDRVIIRFAGDSGDGMQLTGDRFTSETASFGNDLSTLPNFPAEIRAPAGTLPGVSSFQLHFADHDILTPGDAPNVLVAMNPAALKANIEDLPRGAEIIVNTDEFTKRALAKVGYAGDPLQDGSLDAPFNPVSLALGAEATFVARTVDSDRKHLIEVLRQAAEHNGTALVEIYQNCNIFNDGAFDVLKDRQQAEETVIPLAHGQPIRFGAERDKGVVRDPVTGDLAVVTVTEDDADRILVHDAHAASPATAFALSRLADPDTLHRTPIGVFRSVERPVYDTLMADQLEAAVEQHGKGDLAALVTGGDTWTVV